MNPGITLITGEIRQILLAEVYDRLSRQARMYETTGIVFEPLEDGFVSRGRSRHFFNITDAIEVEKCHHEIFIHYRRLRDEEKKPSYVGKSDDDLKKRAQHFHPTQSLDYGCFVFEEREQIIVDTLQDKTLSSWIDEFRENIRDKEDDDEEVLKYLVEFVRLVCGKRHSGKKDDFSFTRGRFGQPWLLSDAIMTGYAECRHYQLLSKIIADRCEIPCFMQRGRVFLMNNRRMIDGAHAWCVFPSNGGYYLGELSVDTKDWKLSNYFGADESLFLKQQPPKQLYKFDEYKYDETS